jgi:hypothetical protein
MMQPQRAVHMGKIVGIQGPHVLIKTNNGLNVRGNLSLDRKLGSMKIMNLGPPKVEVTGKIRTEDLWEGCYVRFTATLQGKKRFTALEELKELNVFTPDPATRFGVQPEAEGAGDPDQGKAEGAKKYLVVGPITGIRSGMITVDLPEGSVKARVADDAVINLKSDRLGPACIDADVTLEGIQLPVPAPVVEALVISLAVRLPPPPPPGKKLARRPATNSRNGATGRKNPFDVPAAGDAAPDAAGQGGEKTGKVPGKILKVN